MAIIYRDLIKDGLWAIDKVPTRWREQVEALLTEEGV